MAEKDFREEELRKQLFEVRMKLAILANKEDDPNYDLIYSDDNFVIFERLNAKVAENT